MIECFVQDGNATPLIALTSGRYEEWKQGQPPATLSWLENSGFKPHPQNLALLPDPEGGIQAVLYIYTEGDLWEFGALPRNLPAGTYELQTDLPCPDRLALGWALECYRFNRFKSTKPVGAKLVWSQDSFESRLAQAVYWVRDLVNRPANDLPPEALAQEAEDLATQQGASIRLVKGEDLVTQNYPAIYAVGQAGPTPCLIDLKWGDPSHPKVTLVGKGVCFDTGGLDLKHHHGMRLMKKDMAGAAHVLGLGRLIMEQNLPIQLRVIIAAVENGVSSNAMHPGDVIQTRKGLTVEVGNTDAEGRVILADCLALAVEDTPELIVDFATLTGAARIALGAELPALFSNDSAVVEGIHKHSDECRDSLWPMPLWKDYQRLIESKVADLSNEASSIYGGAISAALFLEHFVGQTPWVHIDMMAWNPSSRLGRPEGGEATGLRAVYSYLQARYGEKRGQ